MTAGFEKLGEVELVAGKVVTFARVTLRDPGGVEFERDVLRHPGVVAALPLHDDDTVTLVRQYRAAIDREVLEVPAGTRDIPGEPPAVAMARELAEEAGLAAEALHELATYHVAPGLTDEMIVLYLARGLTEVPTDRHGPEEQAMTVERIPFDAALAMVEDGRITDAKTIIGLTLTSRLR